MRENILAECLARTLKNEWRAVTRKKMQELKFPAIGPYIKLTYDYLKDKLYYREIMPSYFSFEKKKNSQNQPTEKFDFQFKKCKRPL